MTVKNESNYDFENDDLSFVAIYKNDENLVICQNDKIKQLKSHEKKDISVEFFVANKSLEKLEIKLILQNKNSDNIIQSNEFFIASNSFLSISFDTISNVSFVP